MVVGVMFMVVFITFTLWYFQGGAYQSHSDIAMTAFVVTALLECKCNNMVGLNSLLFMYKYFSLPLYYLTNT